jgi:hypothetical protein
VGYKKLHSRDEISGLHVHQDVQPGSYGAEELAKRNQSRLEDLNARIKADWPSDMTSTDASADHETYGNAGSKLPRPTDVSSHGADRYGIAGGDGNNPGKPNVAKPAPRSNSKESK